MALKEITKHKKKKFKQKILAFYTHIDNELIRETKQKWTKMKKKKSET